MEEIQTASSTEEAISPLWNAIESTVRSKLQSMNPMNVEVDDFDEETFLSVYKRFLDQRQQHPIEWSEIKHVGAYHVRLNWYIIWVDFM